MEQTGKVYLIGAGPGDPGLLTVRGQQLLQSADVVVYDYLANPALLRLARPEAELIYVGKKGYQQGITQAEINERLVELARAGKQVARLKGGDPFVFGRGGEEAQVLQAAGVEFEIVPGVTSAIAVPAYAGIPVTHRGFVSSFTVLTAHEDPDDLTPEARIDWPALARVGGTLVLMMGVSHLDRAAGHLIAAGKPATTPVACIRWGTTWEQQVVTGTLADIAAKARAAGLKPPAVTVIGEVVNLRDELRWFDLPHKRPLLGKRIGLVGAQPELAELLSERGAQVVEWPQSASAPANLINLLAANQLDLLLCAEPQALHEFARTYHSTTGQTLAEVPENLPVAALGQPTGQTLRDLGRLPDLEIKTGPAQRTAELLCTWLVGSQFD